MNDPEIRELLYPTLEGGSIIDELPIGNETGKMTRADVVHITPDLMHGYEIKGDGDTLKRVPLQVGCYSRVFDRVTFVVTSKHLARILLPGRLPEWAGLAEVGKNGINMIFEAQPVPELDREQLGALLWQKEMLAFLKSHNIKAVTKLRVWECWDLLKDPAIPLDSLRSYVRERLVARLSHRLRRRELQVA